MDQASNRARKRHAAVSVDLRASRLRRTTFILTPETSFKFVLPKRLTPPRSLDGRMQNQDTNLTSGDLRRILRALPQECKRASELELPGVLANGNPSDLGDPPPFGRYQLQSSPSKLSKTNQTWLRARSKIIRVVSVAGLQCGKNSGQGRACWGRLLNPRHPENRELAIEQAVTSVS